MDSPVDIEWNSRTTLFDLPDELLLHILSYASYTSRITLQLTNRRLNALLADASIPRGPRRCLDLLLLEQLLPTPSVYTCTHCLNLLPRSSFILSQTRDCPKGYWKIETLLAWDTVDKRRSDHAHVFLYSIRAPPIDQGRRRMLAASQEAGMRAVRSDGSPWVDAAATSTTSEPAQPTHPPLSPWAIREPVRIEGPKKYKIPRPPHSERICIDCGVKQHIWSSNHMLRFPRNDDANELGTGIICKRCNRFAECAPDSRAMLTKRCEQCLQYRPPGAR